MSLKNYLQKIGKEFPKISFKKAKLLTHGFDYDAVVLDKKYIFRFRKKEARNTLSFKREILLLRKLAPLISVKIPAYDFIARDYSFGRYLFISGEHLTKRKYQRLSPLAKKRIAKQLGDFLTTLHNFSLTEAKKIGLRGEWPILRQLKEYQKRKRYIFSVLSKEEKDFVNKFIGRYAALVQPKRQVVLHYDISDDHLLIQEGNLSDIIDFGDAALGDPAEDFTWLWTLGEDFVKRVYFSYQGPKDSSFLSRSRQYYFAMFLSKIYHGVRDKKKKLLKSGLGKLRKMIKEKDNERRGKKQKNFN